MYENYNIMASTFESYMVPDDGQSATEGVIMTVLALPTIAVGVVLVSALISNAILEAKRKRVLSVVRLDEIMKMVSDKAKQVEYPDGLKEVCEDYVKEMTPLAKKAIDLRATAAEEALKIPYKELDDDIIDQFNDKYEKLAKEIIESARKVVKKAEKAVDSLSNNTMKDDVEIFSIIRSSVQNVDSYRTSKNGRVLDDRVCKYLDEAYEKAIADYPDGLFGITCMGYDFNNDTGNDLADVCFLYNMDPIIDAIKVRFK